MTVLTAKSEMCDADRDAFELAYATSVREQRPNGNWSPAELASEVRTWRKGDSYGADARDLQIGWRAYRWALAAMSQKQQKIDTSAERVDDGDIATLRLAHRRYEHVRTMNPREFGDMWQRNLRGEGPFDDLVDAAIEGRGKV